MLTAENQRLLEAIQKGICILDAQGLVLAANTAFLRIARCNAAHLLGHSLGEFMINLSVTELYHKLPLRNIALNFSEEISLTVDLAPFSIAAGCMGAVAVIRDDGEMQELRYALESARGTIAYLERELAKKQETSWSAGRMRSQSREEELLSRLKPRLGFERFIGMSPNVLEALHIAAKAAQVDSTVLLLGESGTGKELVAEGIHAAGPRAGRPMIRVNCAAIPENLLESEFFGYEQGAFTGAVRRKPGRFELADRGTIFLDEIGEMEPGMQSKLLRVLQEQSFERVGGVTTIRVDVRVIAATNRKLEQLVQQKKFREDLYYRLNVLPIALPPLRERTEDIPLLVNAFLKNFSTKLGKRLAGIRKAAMDALVGYRWPGNVRELQNIIERIVVLSEGEYIEVEDIPYAIRHPASPVSSDLLPALDEPKDIFPLAAYEKQIIRLALERYGSYTAAGRALGITHKTVAAKAQKYGIRK